MKKQNIKKGCKHGWHFRREFSNIKMKYIYHDLAGWLPTFSVPKEGERNFAEFVCDKCGETKEVELK